MGARFKECLERVLKHEGGYVNHPKDPGGETNYGITRRTASEYGYHGDMRHIPMSIVEDIYHAKYWRAVSCDAMPRGVDYVLFDCAVNHGIRRAAMFLQRHLKVTVDGWIGLQTINAAIKADRRGTIDALTNQRFSMVRKLAIWATFGRGWTRRYNEVRAQALADIGLAS